jgi:hypothetical protein
MVYNTDPASQPASQGGGERATARYVDDADPAYWHIDPPDWQQTRHGASDRLWSRPGRVRAVLATVFVLAGVVVGLPALIEGEIFTRDSLAAVGFAAVTAAVVYAVSGWLVPLARRLAAVVRARRRAGGR